MSEYLNNINESASFISGQLNAQPEIGIILGTGLGGLIDHMEISHSLSYENIPHFAQSTVESHSGKLHFGTIHGKQLMVMQGRFHFYEGYDMKQIAFPVYVMKALGVKKLIVSNAAGNMNLDWNKGDLMLIEDHINLFPDNPLRGINNDSLGPRFPDMSEAYSRALGEKALQHSANLNITLRKGVYVGVSGPNLETAAEYRFLRRIGADAVGMSTVPEIIAANHCGLECLAISVLTDDCDPDNLQPVNIVEILEVAGKAEKKLSILISNVLKEL